MQQERRVFRVKSEYREKDLEKTFAKAALYFQTALIVKNTSLQNCESVALTTEQHIQS